LLLLLLLESEEEVQGSRGVWVIYRGRRGKDLRNLRRSRGRSREGLRSSLKGLEGLENLGLVGHVVSDGVRLGDLALSRKLSDLGLGLRGLVLCVLGGLVLRDEDEEIEQVSLLCVWCCSLSLDLRL